jgi:hypothetical protein
LNTTNDNITKHDLSKKHSRGVEVHPCGDTQEKKPESSIQNIPIGFPVDSEKLRDLKNKIKNEHETETRSKQKAFVQEDEN